MEIDEGMFYLGLLAASQRVPFLPTRAGLGSDVLLVNPSLRTVTSPYEDGEELVAMPALRLDAAIVHVNRADANGSGQILGPDTFFDELFLGAADRRFMTTERLIETDQFLSEGPLQTMCISRLLTDGVIETPGGAHFTACVPDYGRDEQFQKSYVAAAGDAEQWTEFRKQYLEVSEDEYQSATQSASANGAS
jgi:glutaconate CoA-transferase subunit A